MFSSFLFLSLPFVEPLAASMRSVGSESTRGRGIDALAAAAAPVDLSRMRGCRGRTGLARSQRLGGVFRDFHDS
jgi:hypothetical protein